MRKLVVTLLLFYLPYTLVGTNLNSNTTLLHERKIDNFVVDSINLQLPKSVKIAQQHYVEANYHLSNNNNELAFENFLLSKKEFRAMDSLDKVNKINLKIVSLIVSLENTKVDYKPFLNEAIRYGEKKNNPKYLIDVYTQIGKSFYDSIPKIALDYFKKAKEESNKTKNNILYGKSLRNIGATYAHDKISKLDSALIVYDEALNVFKKEKAPEEIYYTYLNIGKTMWKKKKYKEAIYYYEKADSIPVQKFKNKNKAILYEYMAETYKSIGEYKKSIEYSDKQKVYQRILDEKQQQIALKDIDVKYNTEEKTLENNRLKKITYMVIVILLVFAIISILAYKNLSKKKKIIEQEKLLETQKLETTLKEQELHEIDVMLESQEKERQRIANELHDNLGSMLATLKLNFENLKRHDSNPTDTETKLFEKTDDLIEEAYQKVRNISHLKNLGVIGSEGLVVAVKKMAEKMSVIEKLQINVIPHGLNERLENTLEVMLFRMIQELCTNIIKHSEATEVNIYLTQHNDSELNIIIEDNGKGFNPKEVVAKDGIGLKSIEKKVEQINGTFTIDSIISKGTTIIIDLPI